ncbi:hypothetical protein C667_00270 [Thauera phenylacetica B4P]|uniref:PepSY-associated TM helix domain-containing protein n=1 Tax=Thauera phenylacetica B4P TaxID=1234382 RepID=N6ZXJ1_9RHOO|nr:hypothetical protein C667_00270 [Thauera phenylacetica B4P]
MRRNFLIIHRYLGLVMAGFLLVAGLTGSLLVWNDELEAAINPTLFRVPQPEASSIAPYRIDPLELRQLVASHYPEAVVAALPLSRQEGKPLVFFLFSPPDPVTGKEAELAVDQVFVNPYTGAILGARKWGDIGQGLANLMPFIYRLHFSLALGDIGATLFGIVALLWTIDCVVGAYLTFPASRAGTSIRHWATRWWPSWKLRWHGGAYKRYFDLHRAGGLWPWAMLLMLAWSSVAFNMHYVYEPVMRAVFAHQPDEESLPKLANPRLIGKLDWTAARERGRELMAQAAAREGFTVESEEMLVHDAEHGMYRYIVRSSWDLRDQGGQTAIRFDADSGALLGLWLPSGAAAGDTVTSWLTALHMAAVWGLPFRIFVTLLGLAVASLSITGVYVWWRKRQGRMKQGLPATQPTRTQPTQGKIR